MKLSKDRRRILVILAILAAIVLVVYWCFFHSPEAPMPTPMPTPTPTPMPSAILTPVQRIIPTPTPTPILVPAPVTVGGSVFFENGSHVSAGWNITLENLNESQWNTSNSSTFNITSECSDAFTPALCNFNYLVAGTTINSSFFEIMVRDPEGLYEGLATFQAEPWDYLEINITVSLINPPASTPSPRSDSDGGGGGGGSKPTPPPTITPTPTPTLPPSSLGLLICDADGSNCTKEIPNGLINTSNILRGDNETVRRLLKNNQSHGGTVIFQVTFTEMSEEFVDSLIFQIDMGGQWITVGSFKNFAEPKEIGNIKAEEALPVNMTWQLPSDANDNLNDKGIRFYVEFYLDG